MYTIENFAEIKFLSRNIQDMQVSYNKTDKYLNKHTHTNKRRFNLKWKLPI